MKGALLFIALGIAAAATLQKGAFYLPTSLLLPGLLLVIALPKKVRRVDWLLIVIALFAAYWLSNAWLRGDPSLAAPFFGGLVGFGAAYLTAKDLRPEDRVTVGKGVVGIGMIVAVSGVIGVIWRIDPWALQSDELWRLSGSLTYANAAAYLLAMIIPITVIKEDDRFLQLSTYAAVAALIATLSRGGLLVALIAAAFVAKSLIKSRASAIVFGSMSGMVALALAGRPGPQWVIALALIMGAVGTLWLHRRPRLLIAAAAVGLIAAFIIGRGFLATVLETRAGGLSVEARFAEWSAAVGQFQAEPFLGTGPEKPLSINTSLGRQIARFAHNEYLQVLASSGAIGGAMLLGAIVLIIRRLKYINDLIGRAAAASVLAFALGGSLDFLWHLPAVAMVAGFACAIALPKELSKD